MGERFLIELDVIATQAKAAAEARATPDQLGEVFKRLSLACRGQPGSDAPRAATVALFLRYLCDYPADVLSDAADEWIKTQVFMPAIAEMKALCEARLAKLYRAWRRAEALAQNSRAYHARREAQEQRTRELAEDRARNPSAPVYAPPKPMPPTRALRNRDTDTPEEKRRIAEICARARQASSR